MNDLDKLVELFTQFPGIGPRQARRFVYFLLGKDRGYLQEITKRILEVKDHVKQCGHCYRYFFASGATPLCNICADPVTEKSSLMIVAKDADLESVRRSSVYDGRYFVLGGSIPILEKEPARRIREKELATEIRRALKDDGLKEIILALSANPEGEHTTEYLKGLLAPLVGSQARISVLGRGLSTGTELEYSDGDTLRNALKHRE